MVTGPSIVRSLIIFEARTLSATGGRPPKPSANRLLYMLCNAT